MKAKQPYSLRGVYLRALATLALGAWFVAACGSTASTTNTNAPAATTAPTDALTMPTAPNSTTVSAESALSEDDKTRVAREAGAAAALAPSVAIPAQKLGVVLLYGTNEDVVAMADNISAAGQQLGWQTVTCDGEGNPTKMAACADSLLAQQIDILITISIEPAIVQKQLADARAQGVLTASVGVSVTSSDLFDVQYALDERGLSQMLAAWLVERLADAPGSKQIALQTFTQIQAGKEREEEMKAALVGAEINVADEHRNDLARIAEDARRATEAQITAYPELQAIWVAPNFGFPHVSQVVDARFQGKQFPERPLVVGFIDNTANIDALRKGWGDAIASHSYGPEGWVLVDQLAQYVARDQPFEPDVMTRTEEVYGLTFFTHTLITRENLPDTPRLPLPADVATFFSTKWAAEFTR
jgi:ABC-type sugar transport system substrate-binding protein